VPLAPPTRYRICLSLLCLPSFDFELPPIAFSSLLSRRQKPVSDRYPADQSRATEIRDDGNVRRSDLCQLWPIEVHGDCADRQPLVWLSTPPYTRKTLSLRGWSHHNRADAWVPVRQVKVSGTVSESEYTHLSHFPYWADLILWGPIHDSFSGAVFPSVLLPLQSQRYDGLHLLTLFPDSCYRS
jgi:hypothetical protein